NCARSLRSARCALCLACAVTPYRWITWSLAKPRRNGEMDRDDESPDGCTRPTYTQWERPSSESFGIDVFGTSSARTAFGTTTLWRSEYFAFAQFSISSVV